MFGLHMQPHIISEALILTFYTGPQTSICLGHQGIKLVICTVNSQYLYVHGFVLSGNMVLKGNFVSQMLLANWTDISLLGWQMLGLNMVSDSISC